jgi:adenosine deaminase CECR1
MMKGLFNYKTAFTKYTRLCLEDFVQENIQYAEIRPNFMQTNQIWEDDGEKQIDNAGTMDIIAEQCDKFLETHSSKFIGVKVIYGTPRVFTRDQIMKALDECLEFKKNPKYSHYIAGFDLMGPEHEGKPLSHFLNEFLAFKEKCRRELNGQEIPFLFHAGENFEDPDRNLECALVLDSKRIGHGYALPGKPYLMAKYKERNICVEACPISNQVLGLASRQRDHRMYELLANDIHCTVNSDNGTLFGSSLSHDFYEVMIGRENMNLFGWKQLIKWSIEHSCLEDYTREYTVHKSVRTRSRRERAEFESMWNARWTEFIDWINMEFKDVPIDETRIAQA